MRLNLEKCQICSTAALPDNDRCGFCGSPFIFAEYYLDVTERALYKDQLGDYKRKWEDLNQYLKTLLEMYEDKWNKSDYWSDIWRQISRDAILLQLDEPSIIKLADSLSKQSPGADKSRITYPDFYASPPKTEYETVREKIAEWVTKLPNAEYNVVDWLDFTASLGNIFGYQELCNILQTELDRQFISFYTESVSDTGEVYDQREKTAKRFVEMIESEIELVMIKISGGTFEMGDDNWNHTKPVRTVSVKDFYIGMIPVTQMQWIAVSRLPAIDLELKQNPSYFRGYDLPMDSVGWFEAVEFCKRLSKHTGRNYRLPSEVEWEYAARAGSNKAYAFGDILNPSLANYAFADQSVENNEFKIENKTSVAGSLIASAYGLYDMHGNVWEWCADVWHKSYTGAPENAQAWTQGGETGKRVLRGGAWCNWADLCRSGERIAENEDKDGKLFYTGFRLALDL